ncbi:uncharacterized protein LOC143879525 isoform X2 [Tasmannia lanceolata]|uniref:uncharacterized protein LOC143879525 isoform X2 n=1 Tax=Tasmannia lanceolata TaxID=3420 RepID=UPI0040629E91
MEVLESTQGVSFLDTSTEDMTAVSLPATGPNNLDANMKIASNVICIFSFEEQLRSLSKENMGQIRNTMMQHEELFKEQVQALHRLYNAQKSAMQEISKMIRCPGQLLASNFGINEVCDGQLHSSFVERKPLKADYFTAQNYYMDKSHPYESFSMHTICAVKEFTRKSPKSAHMDDKELKTLPNDRNKLRRKIDLERPPEEYMDESDYQMDTDNFDISDAKTSLLGRTQHAVEGPPLGCNQSVVRIGSPSLKRRDSGLNFITLSETQDTHQACHQDLESKIDADYVKKCTAGIQNLQKALEHNMLQDFPWNHLPAVGNCSVCVESKASPDQNVEKPSWMLQGSLPFAAQRVKCTHNSDFLDSEQLQVKGSLSPENACFTSSTHTYQSLESGSKISVPHSKLDQQLQQDSDAFFPSNGVLFSTHPVIFPQASATHKSVESDIRSIPGLTLPENNSLSDKHSSYSWGSSCQTGEADVNENPNCSGQGSNSPTSEGIKVCRDVCLSSDTAKNVKCGTNCGPLPMSHGEGKMQSEHKETPQFTDVIIKPSPTETNQKEPIVAELNKEEPENVSTLDEACETIAAKILLSFAPCRSLSDPKWRRFQTWKEAESSHSSRDSTGHGKKQNQCTRRILNFSNRVGVDEAVKWTKSVRGRRRRNTRRQR